MDVKLVETEGGNKVVYDSIVISPSKIKAISSRLSMRLVKELAKGPSCPMDLSRRLKDHEQKIYYHIRKLKDAGIIKRVRKEKRAGMTASIYRLTSPVVSVKLSEEGVLIDATEENGEPAV